VWMYSASVTASFYFTVTVLLSLLPTLVFLSALLQLQLNSLTL